MYREAAAAAELERREQRVVAERERGAAAKQRAVAAQKSILHKAAQKAAAKEASREAAREAAAAAAAAAAAPPPPQPQPQPQPQPPHSPGIAGSGSSGSLFAAEQAFGLRARPPPQQLGHKQGVPSSGHKAHRLLSSTSTQERARPKHEMQRPVQRSRRSAEGEEGEEELSIEEMCLRAAHAGAHARLETLGTAWTGEWVVEHT